MDTECEAPARTILLVDDHAEVREVARRILAEEGYRVLVAGSAARAMEVGAQPGAIDLAIIELDLPDMGGVQLAGRLRRDHPGARLIYMSGYPDAPDAIDGPLLDKPFQATALLQLIRAELADADVGPDAA